MADDGTLGRAIGIVITVIVALVIGGVVITVGRGAANKASGSMQQVDNMLADADAEELRSIDGTAISGSSVYNYLKQYKDDAIQVIVKTKSNSTTYNYKSANFADTNAQVKDNAKLITATQRKGEKNYINPTGNFVVKVKYDQSENPESITFTQE